MTEVHETTGDVKIMKDVRVVGISTLSENSWNPNQMADEMMESVIHGIKTEGFLTPVLIQASSNRIIDGAHRYKAAKKLGMTEILAQFIDVDDNQAKKLTLALNNRRGENDSVLLDNLLADLSKEQDFSGLDVGMPQDYLDRVLKASSQWIDDLADDDHEDDSDVFLPDDTKDVDIPETPGTNFTKLQYIVKPEQRDTIIEAIKLAKAGADYDHSGDALESICKFYLASKGETQ